MKKKSYYFMSNWEQKYNLEINHIVEIENAASIHSSCLMLFFSISLDISKIQQPKINWILMLLSVLFYGFRVINNI